MNQARFSELRVLRWHDQISGILEGKNLGPIRASIDLTNLCNHKCYFCEPAEYRAETIKDRKHTLDPTVALAAIKDLHDMGCTSLGLSGGGEPLVHPEFGRILSFAKGLGFKVWVNTNGSFIEKWLTALSCADVVRISLDAANKEQHERMHGASDFDKIIAGIEKLAGKTEVGISYILDGKNGSEADIAWVQDFAKKIGAYVQFKSLSDKEHMPELGSDDKRLKDVFYQREFSKCYAAKTTCVIGANGDVQACCDRRDLVYGNIYRDSIKAIWNSDLHKSVADGIIPAFCERCLMCGFNRGVEQLIVRDDAKAWLQ